MRVVHDKSSFREQPTTLRVCATWSEVRPAKQEQTQTEALEKIATSRNNYPVSFFVVVLLVFVTIWRRTGEACLSTRGPVVLQFCMYAGMYRGS